MNGRGISEIKSKNNGRWIVIVIVILIAVMLNNSKNKIAINPGDSLRLKETSGVGQVQKQSFRIGVEYKDYGWFLID